MASLSQRRSRSSLKLLLLLLAACFGKVVSTGPTDSLRYRPEKLRRDAGIDHRLLIKSEDWKERVANRHGGDSDNDNDDNNNSPSDAYIVFVYISLYSLLVVGIVGFFFCSVILPRLREERQRRRQVGSNNNGNRKDDNDSEEERLARRMRLWLLFQSSDMIRQIESESDLKILREAETGDSTRSFSWSSSSSLAIFSSSDGPKISDDIETGNDSQTSLTEDIDKENLTTTVSRDIKLTSSIPSNESTASNNGITKIDDDDDSHVEMADPDGTSLVQSAKSIQTESTASDEDENEGAATTMHGVGCVICFEPYQIGDVVVRSNNPACPHMYHCECLLDYFAIKKEEKSNTMLLPCPFCRQSFCLEVSTKEKIEGSDS